MKKLTALFLCLALCLTFAACGCEHEWQEASCDAPRLCTLCGETEGEKLSHEWQAATCTAPEVCALCAGTRGEPLGHDLTEPDRHDPARCTRCGEEQGLSLTDQALEKFPQDAPRHEDGRFLMDPEEFMLLYLHELETMELYPDIQQREVEDPGVYVVDLLVDGVAVCQISLHMDQETSQLFVVSAGTALELTVEGLEHADLNMLAVNAALDVANPLMDGEKWGSLISGGEMSYTSKGFMIRNSFDGVGCIVMLNQSDYFMLITPDLTMDIFQ